MRGKLLLASSALVLLGIMAVAVFILQKPPTGPVPIDWDRANCAECKMAISDRNFAAQLQTREGEVYNFDDPGCLFVFLKKHPDLKVRAIYFWSYTTKKWLRESETAFIRVERSPMGYGIASVPKGTPNSFSIQKAKEIVQKKLKEH